MLGKISEEREVKVPASEAWKVYGSLQLAKLVEKHLPEVSRVDIVQGDGSAGTVLHVFFHPGKEGGMASYKELFTVVDEEKRVKIVEVVEGGYLDLGFTLYRVMLEVISKEEAGKQNECITRVTVEYELKEEAAANASLVSIQPFVTILQIAADYLHQNYHDDNNSSDG